MSQAAHPLQLETTLQLFWCHFSAEHSNSLSPLLYLHVIEALLNLGGQQPHVHVALPLGLRRGGALAHVHTALERKVLGEWHQQAFSVTLWWIKVLWHFQCS